MTPWPVRFADFGLYVFPIIPGDKVPYKDFKWKEEATNDPDKVREYLGKEEYAGCNWACAPWLSKHTVLDIDVKNGEDGFKTLRENGLELPEGGFRVATPHTGMHVYLDGPMRNWKGMARYPGLEVKSVGGYVLIPGSRVSDSDKPYRVVSGALGDFPPVLDWLYEIAGSSTGPDPGASREPLVELDLDHNVERAVRFLVDSAPEAVEGHGGDNTTVWVAMRVKDFGVSEATTLQLMAEHWNDTKAFPPWDIDKLAVKVHNGHKYGQKAPGVDSLDVMFPTTTPMFKPWSTWDAEKRPPRKWVLNGRYMIGYVTMTVADGGVGKSSLTIAEAVAVATGRRDIVGREVMIKGPVAISNIEDPEDELQSKIDAVGLHFKVPLAERANVHAASGYGTDWRLVVKGKDPGESEAKGVGPVATALKDKLIAGLKEIGAVLWVVDPFVYLHGMNENDNQEMSAVMRVLSEIAERAQVAISVVHHSRKPGSGKTDASEGMHVSRGASSVMAAARFAHVLGTMSADAAKKYGVPEDQRKWYVKLEEPKANLSPPMGRDVWFRRVSVDMPNGDSVGTLEPVELRKGAKAPEGLEEKILALIPGLDGTLTKYQAIEQLREMGVKGAKGGGSKPVVRRLLEDCLRLNGKVIKGDDVIVSCEGDKLVVREIVRGDNSPDSPLKAAD